MGSRRHSVERLAVAACAMALLLCAEIWGVRGQSAACASDLSAFLPHPFNASGLSCTPVWNDFVLRYSKSEDNILSIVLSTVYTSGWVGMGFSKDGMMVGSSAMVGWVGRDHKTHIRQYYLRGRSSSKVVVNEGKLNLNSSRPAVAIHGANMYMAFQVKFPDPVSQQSLLFAIGSANPKKAVLTEHQDRISINFDFSADTPLSLTGGSFTSSYPYKLKRTHGALAIVGWGVLLPIGAIVARYCRQWDPLWYYLHLGIQFSGFVIGLAAAVAGIALYNKLHADVAAHRGLGIFILVLGILQVIAFFARPNKNSKYRRYWNWYHHWFGRLALFLGAVNIALGIRVGRAGRDWKVGYGVNLALILIAVVTLEILLWLRSKKPSAIPKY